MQLVEFLESSGWSKAELSRKIGVSKQAIGQWDDIPVKWEVVLRGFLESGEIPPEPEGKFIPTDLELLRIIRERSKTTDVAICLAHGWRVWEFNKMIADLVGKYPSSDPFWKQVKSDSDIRRA